MNTELNTDRTKVRHAFRLLRSADIKARMAYKCCSGCALAAADDELGLKSGDDFVFFHQQDADAFGADDNLERRLMIRFTGPAAPKAALVALRSAGLDAEWDGNAYHCIQINPTSKEV